MKLNKEAHMHTSNRLLFNRVWILVYGLWTSSKEWEWNRPTEPFTFTWAPKTFLWTILGLDSGLSMNKLIRVLFLHLLCWKHSLDGLHIRHWLSYVIQKGSQMGVMWTWGIELSVWCAQQCQIILTNKSWHFNTEGNFRFIDHKSHYL